MYVHKDYQRKDIATTLCEALEKSVPNKIITHASITVRPFLEIRNDLEALFEIFSDEEVNVFLLWYSLKTMEDTSIFYSRCFESKYQQKCSYNYAICLKDDNYPIGYVNVDVHDSYDIGYGLCKEFWHKGIVTEACRAVIGN